jgi:hypothetical protein
VRARRHVPVDNGYAPVDVAANYWNPRKAHLHTEGRRGQANEAFVGPPRAELAGPRKGQPRQSDPRHRAAGGASNHVKIDPVKRARLS